MTGHDASAWVQDKGMAELACVSNIIWYGLLETVAMCHFWAQYCASWCYFDYPLLLAR